MFYDLTTIRAAGLSEQPGDVRHCRMAKEGVVARQFILDVVQTAVGLPIYHEVFDGNQAEGPTLLPPLRKVVERFPHFRRLIVVADRGLLWLDNLEELGKIKLPGEAPNTRAMGFTLAVPGRRYGEFTEVLQAIQAKASTAQQELIEDARWQDLRLVVAHLPQRVLPSKRCCATNASRHCKTRPCNGRANSTDKMALIVHRVMRQRLKLAKSEPSPDQALAQLRPIQRHSVSINRAAPVAGVVRHPPPASQCPGRTERQETRHRGANVIAVVAA